MKQWIFGSIILLCGLIGQAQTTALDDYNAMSESDRELINKIISLVDNGMWEAVVPDFDMLAKKYPTNFFVQYERLYNLYHLGRYEEAIKASKSLLKLKNADATAYQLVGNAYDLTGNRKKAAKIYNDGLKRFPNSGSLYMELGTLSLLDKDYVKALDYYNRGIVAQPNFDSNYYRAAQLYLSSDKGKVWGLVYAEAAVLLAPSNDQRHEEMARMIVDCLKSSITMSYGEDSRLSVKLVPSRGMSVNKEYDTAYLDFPGIYEGALAQPLTKIFLEKEPFTCSLQQLIEIRKGLVESYFSATDNLYGNSMYLLEFQKKIIDAGHWDAYNYFLFMTSFPEEFKKWYAADSTPLDSFIDWYNKAPFTLGDGRSVSSEQIFDSYRPIDMMQAIMIQGKLITKTPGESSEE